MGKQTAVAMTDEDEIDFLNFIRQTADIKILESSAPSKESIWVDKFAPRQEGHWQYYIWNTSFLWTPQFGEITGEQAGNRRGWYFISNSSIAPVIEYDRHNFDNPRWFSNGRLYWSKSFAAPNGLSYDIKAFDQWYMKIIRWIRKNGTVQQQRIAPNTYFLPHAFTKYSITHNELLK